MRIEAARAAWKSAGRDRATLLVPAGLVVAGLVVTLFRIGSKSVWYDEALSIRYATSDLGAVIAEVVGRDSNGSLYLATLRAWVAVVGDGEGAIRALSAAFAVLTLVIVYAIGARMAGRVVGLGAAILLLFSRMYIVYAQEARMYAMAMCASALATYMLLRAVQQRGRGALVAYAVVMGLGIYTHLFVGFVAVAHVLWLASRALRSRRRGDAIDLVIASSLIALISLPLAPYVLLNAGPSWIAPLSTDTLRFTFRSLAGESSILLIIAAASAAIVAVSLVRGRPALSDRRAAVELALLWALVPIAIGISISLVKSMLVARYFIVTLPAFCLVVAYATLLVRPRPLRAAAYASVLVLTMVQGLAWYETDARSDWRRATQAIAGSSSTVDRITFFERNGQLPFDYYVRRLGLDGEVPLRLDEARLYPGGKEARPPRIWLILHYQVTGETPAGVVDLMSRLGDARYRQWGKDRPFGNVKIRLMIDTDLPPPL